MIDRRIQAIFKRSRHNKLSDFIISQDYYELPKRTFQAIGNTSHIIKPNYFRDFQNLYRDKAQRYMTLKEFKLLTYSHRNEKYQPLTIDMTKVKNIGRYQLGLKSFFLPDSSSFQFS